MAVTDDDSGMLTQILEGKVAFVYPYLDPASRTGRVRIALPNKGVELKPDMFATVTFELPLGDRLQIPTSAVVYTGPRRLVFVDLGDGRIVPQEITVGARSGDRVEVLSGLDARQLVVQNLTESLAPGQLVDVLEPAAK